MAQRKERENKRYVWEGHKGRLINIFLDYKQHSWILFSAKQMMKCQNFRLICSWLFPLVLRYAFHTIQSTKLRLLHIRCLQLFLKKSGKGWSQLQHKHREGKMLWASISRQTAHNHFLKGERYHSSTVSPCAQILSQHQGEPVVSWVSFNVYSSVRPRSGHPKLSSETHAHVHKRKEFNID